MRHSYRSLFAAIPVGLLGSFSSCYSPNPSGVSAAQALTVCHTTVVAGVDVSEFQGVVDWPTVHAQGVEFAIARIGDGTYHDAQFDTNWPAIQAAGMIRGAYLFFRPTETAAVQATAIATAVGTLGAGDLPVTIDVECMCPFLSSGACDSATAGCTDPATATSVLQDLVNQVQASTGKVPMIYTGSWFWDGTTYLDDQANFGANPLWVSGYVSPPTCVTVPQGWSDWNIWQWTDAAQLNGFPSQLPDGDRFNGTLTELQAFANGSAAPTWGGTFVSQSFPYASVGPVMINAGSSAPASITMRNSGTATWDSNTRIATTQPRDHVDPFAAPDWIASNRPSGVPAGMTVPPGSSYEFQFTFSVPATMAPGMYTENFGMVEDGTAWFSDPGELGPPDNQLEAIVQVLPPLAADAGEPGSDAAVDDGSTTDAAASDAASHDASGPVDARTTDATETADGAMNDAGTDAPSAADAGTTAMQAGCGCRTAGRSQRSSTAAWLGIALAAVSLTRRRRAGTGVSASRVSGSGT